ncbi:MAG: DUF1800 domain-containing protein [Saprospiraceae bacterium]
MPISTMTRRAFFRGKSEDSAKTSHTVKNSLGMTIGNFPFAAQELPDVPPPAEKITLNGTLNPYNGPWGYEQAAHLLRRTGFGLKKSEVDALMAMDMDSAVDQVLAVPANLPSPPLNNYNNPDFTDPNVPLGQTWVNQPFEQDAEFYRVESWRGWWLDRMINQSFSIQERLTLFWHNHFATETQIVPWGRSCYEYNQILRENAMGNFKDFVKSVTKEGMMLVYLNGYLNKAGAPDENYARELQELFTIGKEGGQPFTEDDVVAAARVLTGWRINFPTNNDTYHFPTEHDFNDKQFSAFYNNTVIQGSIDGDAELDALLDMIFQRPEVAVFICRKLYRWFVYYDITPDTEANVIQPLADIFRNNNYEIKPVLEALLKSEHFFEAAQTGCFIKTPVDISIGAMRTYNLTIPASTPWDQLIMQYYLSLYLSNMSMLPGDPPNVAGWQAFRQTPQYYRIWINGDTLKNRNSFTDILTASFIASENDTLSIDLLAFAAQFDHPEDPVALIDDMMKLLLPQPISAAKKFLLKTILLSGLPSDSYWTAAWNEYINNPGDPMAKEVVRTRLLALNLYVTRLAEFQLA